MPPMENPAALQCQDHVRVSTHYYRAVHGTHRELPRILLSYPWRKHLAAPSGNCGMFATDACHDRGSLYRSNCFNLSLEQGSSTEEPPHKACLIAGIQLRFFLYGEKCHAKGWRLIIRARHMMSSIYHPTRDFRTKYFSRNLCNQHFSALLGLTQAYY